MQLISATPSPYARKVRITLRQRRQPRRALDRPRLRGAGREPHPPRGAMDLFMLGRPTIANPHRPLYAAMVLGENAPYDMLPIQHSHALKRTRDEVNCGGFGPIARRG